MKKGYVRALLTTDNEAAVLASIKDEECGNHYHGILQLIAQVMDQAASGEDIYLTLGATKNRDSFIATVIWDGARTYATGASLEAVSQVAETLLD